MLDKNIFAFDFLNDDFSTLPQTLQEILKDEKKREKLIIFINPPYAEAASAKQVTGTGANKAQVALNNLKIEPYKNLYGKASNELFAQFFMRIYEEIKGCKLAQFSTLKIVQASNFIKFRERFKAKFLKGFVCPANTFDNVKGQFPIGFLIWDTKIKSNLKEIQVDIFEQDGEFLGHKKISAQNQNDRVINDWYSNFYDKNGNEIGVMNTRGNDFQNQNYIRITSINNFNHTNIITISNLIPSCIYFSVRHAIEASWLNDRDQFLYPNDEWQKDTEFQNDCLAFTLFHEQNRISSIDRDDKDKKMINHFIPFNASEVADGSFLSDFMYKFINGKFGDCTCHTELLPESEVSIKSNRGYFANAQYDKKNKAQNDGILPFDKKEINLPAKKSFIPDKPLEFSKEAKAVFDAGREIWRYYHQNARQNDYNENASLYDIKEHFQGRNEKGRMNARSDDEHYNGLMATLRLALKDLAIKITPKIYEYDFLRE